MQTLADDLLLHELDPPMLQVRAVTNHCRSDPRVRNAEGGNKGVRVIDRRASSVLKRR